MRGAKLDNFAHDTGEGWTQQTITSSRRWRHHLGDRHRLLRLQQMPTADSTRKSASKTSAQRPDVVKHGRDQVVAGREAWPRRFASGARKSRSGDSPRTAASGPEGRRLRIAAVSQAEFKTRRADCWSSSIASARTQRRQAGRLQAVHWTSSGSGPRHLQRAMLETGIHPRLHRHRWKRGRHRRGATSSSPITSAHAAAATRLLVRHRTRSSVPGPT